MFKKSSYTVLLIILVVLAGIYLIAEYSGSKERSFESKLSDLDTARITEVYINQPGSPEITLFRENSGWKIEYEEESYPADQQQTVRLLTQLMDMTAEKVAALEESKWEELQVTDEKGIRVIAREGHKTAADLFIGRLTYVRPSASGAEVDPQLAERGKMITYVRPYEETTVYGVEGFLRPSFNRSPEDFRDKTIVALDPMNVDRIRFDYPSDSSYTLEYRNGKWFADGMLADSARTVRYLGNMRSQKGQEFANDYDVSARTPDYKLTIEGSNFRPVEVAAYKADSIHQYVITSSINPGSLFRNGDYNTFDKIFQEKEFFTRK